MFSKPFKPPLLKNLSGKINDDCSLDVKRPAKRQRIDDEEIKKVTKSRSSAATANSVGDALIRNRTSAVSRGPLVTLNNPPRSKLQDEALLTSGEGYYMVLWRKYTTKKHKTWDGDGVLAVRDGYASLQDISGRDMGRMPFTDPLLPGSTLSLGGKEVEVDSLISKANFIRGMPFSNNNKLKQDSAAPEDKPQAQITTPLVPEVPKRSIREQMKAEMCREEKELLVEKNKPRVATPLREGSRTAFKNPLKDITVMRQIPGAKPLPRHDPNVPGALVMERPRHIPQDRSIVDVVLDPSLGKHLRPHQRKGVEFLYECVMGMRDYGGEGCILADEMGLGKTLQVIALLWTLLKQNPFCGAEPVIKKALIVCPVTLINNWQKEFRKWLGNERIGVFVADGKKTRLTDFTMGKSYSVMIIGYERLRTVAEDLTKGAGIDIVIADEGHRLKTVQNKSAQAIQSLNTARRIILSGTPIQNDLSEFFSMVNFVNDGLLGSHKQFTKRFENPIVKSRQPGASEEDVELGDERSAELAQETSKFILRRTADVLSQYLPSKTEYVLFCEPTQTQANMYRHVLASPLFQNALGSSECALQLITILKKLCNSPSLLSPKVAEVDETANSASIISLLETLPQHLLRMLGPQASAKIRILDTFLYTLSRKTSDKIVLVSNYTSTLDLLQTLLTSLSLPFLRLDGSTPSAKRQSLVDDFNRSSPAAVFAFLLSAKAGGLGLNLIGASRLVLFDVDWNPAVEEQAMARIHREGQKKPCRIYRFVLKGGLEERVWQRQVVKRGLANSIMEGGAGRGSLGKKGVAQFSREELRDLFRLDERAGLRTHDLLGCACDGLGLMTAGWKTCDDNRDSPSPTEASSKIFRSEVIEIPDEDAAADDFDDTQSLPDVSTLIRTSLSPSTITLDSHDRPSQSKSQKHKSTPLPPSPPFPTRIPTSTSKFAPEIHGLTDYTIHLDTSSTGSTLAHPPQQQHHQPDDDAGKNARMTKVEEYIDDEVLMSVLRAQQDELDDHEKQQEGRGGKGELKRGTGAGGGGVSWVFVKRSGG